MKVTKWGLFGLFGLFFYLTSLVIVFKRDLNLFMLLTQVIGLWVSFNFMVIGISFKE